MSIDFDERSELPPEEVRLKEAVIPPELIQSLQFDEFQKSTKRRYSMQFVLNGQAYHFDGVVTALATAHKQGRKTELDQLAAVPGVVIRLCKSFTGVSKEYYRLSELVRDSASWVTVLDEKDQ